MALFTEESLQEEDLNTSQNDRSHTLLAGTSSLSLERTLMNRGRARIVNRWMASESKLGANEVWGDTETVLAPSIRARHAANTHNQSYIDSPYEERDLKAGRKAIRP